MSRPRSRCLHCAVEAVRGKIWHLWQCPLNDHKLPKIHQTHHDDPSIQSLPTEAELDQMLIHFQPDQ